MRSLTGTAAGYSSAIVNTDRYLYLLEDNEENRRLQGKHIEVWQYPDGDIELRANGTSLPFTIYDRLGELDQGAISTTSIWDALWR